MKLSHYDRTLIHGLGLMSRPPIVPVPEDHKMILNILSIAADRSSAHPELQPLVREVQRISDNLGPHSGILHLIRQTLNEFDRTCMALHWDAAKGGK